ncbi:helix-turn-helix domain-containing protein, partial [candidate division KSB1 bacterium]|nr:helix-turn-helix domain-containing protein [candidate division KSB1 bacterium]
MMENIGNILKENRKEQGKTLEEINEQTRITFEHLKLLEKNDFTFLPETYVKSFIKNYALTLGLDADDLVVRYTQNQEEKRRLKEELESRVEIETGPSSSTQKAIEWALGVGVFILLISLIIVYFQFKAQIDAQPAEPLQNSLKRESAGMISNMMKII